MEMYAKSLTPMTQCPHAVHHNFECSSGLRVLHQMLVFPQDSKKAERGEEKNALDVQFLYESSTYLSFHQQLKSIKTVKMYPLTKKGSGILGNIFLY